MRCANLQLIVSCTRYSCSGPPFRFPIIPSQLCSPAPCFRLLALERQPLICLESGRTSATPRRTDALYIGNSFSFSVLDLVLALTSTSATRMHLVVQLTSPPYACPSSYAAPLTSTPTFPASFSPSPSLAAAPPYHSCRGWSQQRTASSDGSTVLSSPELGAKVEIRPGVMGALQKGGRGEMSTPRGRAALSTPRSPSFSGTFPSATPERVERIFLSAISFPARVSRFVAHWRTSYIGSVLPPVAQALYPISEPHNLSASDIDVVSVPDFLNLTTEGPKCRTGKGKTWVRVPALLPRLERLPPEVRGRVKVAAALPAMTSAGQSVTLGSDTWQFLKHSPELDTAFWEVEMRDNGGRVKVAFDQAFSRTGSLY